jgi:hypothetical protein
LEAIFSPKYKSKPKNQVKKQKSYLGFLFFLHSIPTPNYYPQLAEHVGLGPIDPITDYSKSITILEYNRFKVEN